MDLPSFPNKRTIQGQDPNSASFPLTSLSTMGVTPQDLEELLGFGVVEVVGLKTGWPKEPIKNIINNLILYFQIESWKNKFKDYR